MSVGRARVNGMRSHESCMHGIHRTFKKVRSRAGARYRAPLRMISDDVQLEGGIPPDDLALLCFHLFCTHKWDASDRHKRPQLSKPIMINPSLLWMCSPPKPTTTRRPALTVRPQVSHSKIGCRGWRQRGCRRASHTNNAYREVGQLCSQVGGVCGGGRDGIQSGINCVAEGMHA